MFLIVKNIKNLSFPSLMDVYYESNLTDAREKYPKETDTDALRKVEADFYSYLYDVFFRIDDAFYAMWTENDRYVCVVRVEPYNDGYLISGLETISAEQRKGYATKLLNETLRRLNKPVYSHIENGNKASLRTHLKCGFENHLDYAVYIDGSVSRTAVTLKYDPVKV